MSDTKKQKFTAPVRRGLHWIQVQARTALEDLPKNALAAQQKRDIADALTWLQQNSETSPTSSP